MDQANISAVELLEDHEMYALYYNISLPLFMFVGVHGIWRYHIRTPYSVYFGVQSILPNMRSLCVLSPFTVSLLQLSRKYVTV